MAIDNRRNVDNCENKNTLVNVSVVDNDQQLTWEEHNKHNIILLIIIIYFTSLGTGAEGICKRLSLFLAESPKQIACLYRNLLSK